MLIPFKFKFQFQNRKISIRAKTSLVYFGLTFRPIKFNGFTIVTFYDFRGNKDSLVKRDSIIMFATIIIPAIKLSENFCEREKDFYDFQSCSFNLQLHKLLF